MWLLVAPRVARVLMVMRASASSRPILASAPRNGAVRGPQPEATARKSGCRLTRTLPWRSTAAAPEWLRGLAPPAWYERYGRRIEDTRLPKSEGTTGGLRVPGRRGWLLPPGRTE